MPSIVQDQATFDTVTVLRSAGGACLTKIIGPQGSTAPRPGTHFHVAEHAIGGLADLHVLLLTLADDPHSAVIRGRLKPGLALDGVHRRNGKTFDDTPHHWVMLDVDSVEAPDSMSSVSVEAVDWLIKNRLPTEFEDASFIVQWSSSAGCAGQLIKAHLWFWLNQPAISPQLRALAKNWPVDAAVFQAVQVHYTASPVFKGVADPLQRPRVELVRRARDMVALRLQAAPRQPYGGATQPYTAPLIDPTGLLTDGREAWLLAHTLGLVRQAGPPYDRPALVAAAQAGFYGACSNADGKWPPERVAGKMLATIERAERGDIPGIGHAARALPPYWGLKPEPLDQVRTALTSTVREWFEGEGPDVLALAYPPGIGKTRAVVAETISAALRGERTAIYVPTVKLGEEIAALIGPQARVIRGRDQPGMCQRARAARVVSAAGLSVTKALCALCQHKDDCAYLAQFKDMPPVLVLSHAHLTLQQRPEWKPDYVVVDESCWSACLDIGSIPIATFLAVVSPMPDLQAALDRGLRTDKVLAELRTVHLAAELMAALAASASIGPEFEGTTTTAEIERRTAERRRLAPARRVIGKLALELICVGRAGSHVVRLNGSEVSYSLLKPLRAVSADARVLVIDAQAQATILEKLFPGRAIVFERRDVLRNAEVVQVVGSVNSKTRLTDPNGPFEKMARLALWLGEGTALFTLKALRTKLTGETATASLTVKGEWNGVSVGHFGNIKGSDVFKDLRNVVIVGRLQPPPSGIEQYSGLYWRDPEPLTFTGEYEYQQRGYCHSSGRGANVHTHVEPRFQIILEQLREYELLQALDRLRLFQPGEPRLVVIATDLPLPLPVSRFVDEADLINEARDLAVQNGGLLLDRARWLAATLPARFAGAKAAQRWLEYAADPFDLVAKKVTIGNKVKRVPPPDTARSPRPLGFDRLAPVAVNHRVAARPSKQTEFKRALWLGPVVDLPAALSDALGASAEWQAAIGGGWGWVVSDSWINKRKTKRAPKLDIANTPQTASITVEDISTRLAELAQISSFSYLVIVEDTSSTETGPTKPKPTPDITE